MQLRKMTLIAAFGAMAMFTAGCGDDDEVTTCTQDSDCGGNEQCVTGSGTSGVCAQNCTSNDDCDSGFTCVTLGSDADGYCGCDSDASCGEGQTCSQLATCVTDGNGGGGTGTSCNGTGQSTCSYGDFCNNGTCADAPQQTGCANFSGDATWNPSSSNGPVIYAIEPVSFSANSTVCQSTAPIAAVTRLRVYRTDGDWPATRSGLNGLFYARVQGTDLDVVGNGLLMPSTGYTRDASNPRIATIETYVCQESTANQVSVGYYFTNGNQVCQTLTR